MIRHPSRRPIDSDSHGKIQDFGGLDEWPNFAKCSKSAAATAAKAARKVTVREGTNQKSPALCGALGWVCVPWEVQGILAGY